MRSVEYLLFLLTDIYGLLYQENMRHVISFALSSAIFMEKFAKMGARGAVYYRDFCLRRVCLQSKQNSGLIRDGLSRQSDLSSNVRGYGDR